MAQMLVQPNPHPAAARQEANPLAVTKGLAARADANQTADAE